MKRFLIRRRLLPKKLKPKREEKKLPPPRHAKFLWRHTRQQDTMDPNQYPANPPPRPRRPSGFVLAQPPPRPPRPSRLGRSHAPVANQPNPEEPELPPMYGPEYLAREARMRQLTSQLFDGGAPAPKKRSRPAARGRGGAARGRGGRGRGAGRVVCKGNACTWQTTASGGTGRVVCKGNVCTWQPT